MKIKGIRIFDKINGIVYTKLSDILKEVYNGNLLHWSILDLYGIGDLGTESSIPAFEEQIDSSPNGFFISWEDLNKLSNIICDVDIFDILIIGCHDVNLLHRFKNDLEMQTTCDIIINKVDSGFWQVFSKDYKIIDNLSKKFKKVEFLKN